MVDSAESVATCAAGVESDDDAPMSKFVASVGDFNRIDFIAFWIAFTSIDLDCNGSIAVFSFICTFGLFVARGAVATFCLSAAAVSLLDSTSPSPKE